MVIQQRTCQLSDLVTKVGSGVTPRGGSKVYKKSGIPFIRSQNVHPGKLLTADLAFITMEQHDGMASTKLKGDDLLLNITGASIGRACVFPKTMPEGNVNQHVCIIRCRKKLLDPNFLSQYLNSTTGQRQISSFQAGGNREGLNFNQIRQFKIPAFDFSEQRKIAEILSCWDRAIEKTEVLIEKKQRQQNGLMQRLLTGETRLKQYKASPLWQSTSLGDIAQILFSTVDKKTVSGQKAVKLCNYMDVYNNTYITSQLPFMQATASNAEISRYSLKKHDVIITKDSETPVDIANTAVVTEELKNVICGYHLGIIRPDSRKVYGPFLAKRLSYGRTHWQFVISANGATRFGLGIGDTKNATVKIPTVEEQKAIFAILLSLDREMEMLSRKVEFLKKEKKALLNVLMSGKMTIS